LKIVAAGYCSFTVSSYCRSALAAGKFSDLAQLAPPKNGNLDLNLSHWLSRFSDRFDQYKWHNHEFKNEPFEKD
jgi:hypothetical protein